MALSLFLVLLTVNVLFGAFYAGIKCAKAWPKMAEQVDDWVQGVIDGRM